MGCIVVGSARSEYYMIDHAPPREGYFSWWECTIASFWIFFNTWKYLYFFSSDIKKLTRRIIIKTKVSLRVPYTQYEFLSVQYLHVSESVPVRKKDEILD